MVMQAERADRRTARWRQEDMKGRMAMRRSYSWQAGRQAGRKEMVA